MLLQEQSAKSNVSMQLLLLAGLCNGNTRVFSQLQPFLVCPKNLGPKRLPWPCFARSCDLCWVLSNIGSFRAPSVWEIMVRKTVVRNRRLPFSL